jgi:hypothetical protein
MAELPLRYAYCNAVSYDYFESPMPGRPPLDPPPAVGT